MSQLAMVKLSIIHQSATSCPSRSDKRLKYIMFSIYYDTQIFVSAYA